MRVRRTSLLTALHPADRLGEVLFALIMALGFTGAAAIGLRQLHGLDLFLAIIGCNFAWAIVDGVMYVLDCLFRRGLRWRIIREVRSAQSEDEARARVAEDLEEFLEQAVPEEARQAIYGDIAKAARTAELPPVRVRSEDIAGGLGVAAIIMAATAPVALPFLLFDDARLAARISNGIAISGLFLLGLWWGRIVGVRPAAVGAGLVLVGTVLVAITVLLGG